VIVIHDLLPTANYQAKPWQFIVKRQDSASR